MSKGHDIKQTRWYRYGQESIQDRHERYAAIFRRLDVNKDGIICIDDLTAALKEMGSSDPSHAQVSGCPLSMGECESLSHQKKFSASLWAVVQSKLAITRFLCSL